MKFLYNVAPILVSSLLIVLLIVAGDYYLKDTKGDAIKIFIPALTTSFGIFLSGMLAIWQQEKIDKRERKLRKRKSYAARSAMPSALDEMCDYARKCAKDLLDIYPTNSNERQFDISQDFSTENLFCCQFPYEAIKVLRECIEHAEHNDRAQIAECLRCLQVHRARINDFKNTFVGNLTAEYKKIQIEKMIFDTCKLYRTCSKLFPYARISKKIPLDPTEEELLLGDLRSIGIYEVSHPELYDKVRRLLSSEDNQL